MMISKGVLILILMVAVVGCATRPAPEPTGEWPATLEEATRVIISEMSEEDKETVRNTPKDDLTKFHHGWGTGIRNELGLWSGNHALMKDCKANHPDDASMTIIENIWEELQKERSSEQKHEEQDAGKKIN